MGWLTEQTKQTTIITLKKVLCEFVAKIYQLDVTIQVILFLL